MHKVYLQTIQTKKNCFNIIIVVVTVIFIVECFILLIEGSHFQKIKSQISLYQSNFMIESTIAISVIIIKLYFRV